MAPVIIRLAAIPPNTGLDPCWVSARFWTASQSLGAQLVADLARHTHHVPRVFHRHPDQIHFAFTFDPDTILSLSFAQLSDSTGPSVYKSSLSLA